MSWLKSKELDKKLISHDEIKEYDDHKRLVYVKHSNGEEEFFKYDGLNNMNYHKDVSGNEYFADYKYDNNGNIIGFTPRNRIIN